MRRAFLNVALMSATSYDSMNMLLHAEFSRAINRHGQSGRHRNNRASIADAPRLITNPTAPKISIPNITKSI